MKNKIRFLPQDIEVEAPSDKSVLEIATQNGLEIKSSCNGMATCAECRVRLVEGDFSVLPPTSKELTLIGQGYYIDQRRLSCQLYCFGNITVDLREQIEKEGDSAVSRSFLKRIKKEDQVQSIGDSLVEKDFQKEEE